MIYGKKYMQYNFTQKKKNYLFKKNKLIKLFHDILKRCYFRICNKIQSQKKYTEF